MSRINFESKVAKKRKEILLKSETSSEEESREAGQRASYLNRLLHMERSENRLHSPEVFLSFAGGNGESLYKEVIPALRSLKIPGERKKFQVLTGMSAKGKPRVMKHIVSKVEQCCIFFGILTREHEISSIDDEGGRYAPGAWVLLEAGMAIGLGLRVVFFVERGVHKGFWLDPLGSWRHAKFDTKSYQSSLKLATGLVLEHYEELRKSTP